jgi:hypothetical protein
MLRSSMRFLVAGFETLSNLNYHVADVTSEGSHRCCTRHEGSTAESDRGKISSYRSLGSSTAGGGGVASCR